MFQKSLVNTAFAIFWLAFAGCAWTYPSPELVSAHTAYQKALQGPASEYNPAGLDDAGNALERAEGANRDREKDFAYVAERKAKTAHAVGQEREAKAEQAEAMKLYTEALETQVGVTTKQRDAARTDLASAEERAATALASLKEVAQVQEDAKGMKITLSGSIVFKTGSATLLPIAEERLSEVADAIEGFPGEPVVVSGHTDSRGSAAYNERPSQQRAESVRTYLVSQGIEADRVRAVGMGESQPVAPYGNPEGRANNRRVEITVGEPQGARGASAAARP